MYYVCTAHIYTDRIIEWCALGILGLNQQTQTYPNSVNQNYDHERVIYKGGSECITNTQTHRYTKSYLRKHIT